MAEHSSLVGKEEKTIDIERKDGLLEELNLPPKVIKFIRENSLNLQIVAGCIVFLILGWTYYDYYTQTRDNKASAALYMAVQEKDVATRGELLNGVINDFSGSDAALWSRIELAHLAFQAGNYEKALPLYNSINADLDGDSPLLPLLSYNIGLAYENSGDQKKALAYYTKLAGFKGFEVKGLMAQGRIYELREEKTEALQVYRAAATREDASSQAKSILAEKINSLQASATAGKDS